MRNAYNILVGKLEGKRLLRRRWEDNLRMDLRKIVWGYGVDASGSG